MLAEAGHSESCGALVAALREERIEGSSLNVIASALQSCAKRTDIDHLGSALLYLESIAKSYSYTHEAVRTLAHAIAAWRDPRATPYLLPFLKVSRNHITDSALTALGKIRDPLAAKHLIAMYERASSSSEKRQLGEMFAAGYPGVVYDTETRKARLVDDEGMKLLMQKREKRIKLIDEGVDPWQFDAPPNDMF